LTAAASAGGEFPWDAVMTLGFGLLRLSSADFWSMTPCELERALRFHGHGAGAAPARSELAALMAAFPDKPSENASG